jgi:hypothetical protein
VSPSSGNVGDHVQVTGSGFSGNGGVIFTIGGLVAQIISGGTADPNGNLTNAVIAVPSLSGNTSYNLIATDTQTGMQSNALTFFVNANSTPLVVQGLFIQTTTNTALSNVTIGAFTDSTGLPASSYTVAINWGDGSPTSSAANQVRRMTGGNVQPAGVSQQYTITGSHTYTSAGTFPINVTIHATDGRTAYLTSIAEVGTGTAATTYQLSVGWNLIGPQLAPGTSVQASAVAASILSASSGSLVAIYALSNDAWSPYYIDQQGHLPSGQDFALHGGQGYLVYSDKAATITIGSATQREERVIHAGLTPAQRVQVPPLPQLP